MNKANEAQSQKRSCSQIIKNSLFLRNQDRILYFKTFTRLATLLTILGCSFWIMRYEAQTQVVIVPLDIRFDSQESYFVYRYQFVAKLTRLAADKCQYPHLAKLSPKQLRDLAMAMSFNHLTYKDGHFSTRWTKLENIESAQAIHDSMSYDWLKSIIRIDSYDLLGNPHNQKEYPVYTYFLWKLSKLYPDTQNMEAQFSEESRKIFHNWYDTEQFLRNTIEEELQREDASLRGTYALCSLPINYRIRFFNHQNSKSISMAHKKTEMIFEHFVRSGLSFYKVPPLNSCTQFSLPYK